MGRMKRFFSRGGGSLYSATITLPFLTFILSYIVSLVQVAISLENLNYSVYSICREAVVCQSLSDAEDVIADKMSEQYGSNLDYFYVFEEVINEDRPDMESTDDGKWNKGDFVKLEITVFVNTASPFNSDYRTASIVMMVENPA